MYIFIYVSTQNNLSFFDKLDLFMGNRKINK